MKVDEQTYHKIRDLYGYAIAKEHVGRRVLMREFDITRTAAEEVLEEIRQPSVDPDNVIVVDSIESYKFDEEERVYRFQGSDPFGDPCNFTETEQNIREMKRDYCMKGYTVKETALKAGYDPIVFREIRDVLDWTHDSLPETDEIARQKEAQEMARNLALEQKKADARKELEKKKRREERKDARKWRKFSEVVLSNVRSALGEDYQPPEVEKTFEPDGTEQKAAIIPTFDVHFGKQGIIGPDGSTYDQKEAESRVVETTKRQIQDLTRYGVEKIFLAFGSDFFHVDNHHGATTGKKLNHATPQDLDGVPGQIFNKGCDLMRNHVDMLRQVAPIEALVIPGNHDRILSFALAKYLQGVYENASDVTVDGAVSTRKYRSYGNTLFGFDHGDRISNKDIESLILEEARGLVGETKETIFLMGHKHHEWKKDLGGATAYGLGSPSDTDRFHDEIGKTAARQQMTQFIVDRDRGMHAHLNYPVNL